MTVNDASVNQVVSQQQAAAETQTREQVRSLAGALVTDTTACAMLIKGVVTAVDLVASPPSITCQLEGDTTTSVPGIVFIDSYSPVVGDTVQIIKQGNSIVAIGQVNDTGTGTANGWITPSLAANFTTNGNGYGPLQYRVVVDNGERKLQFRGAVSYTGSSDVQIFVLVTDARPTTKRNALVSRPHWQGANAMQVEFLTTGEVMMVGGTGVGVTGIASSGSGTTNSVDPNDNTTGVNNPYGGFSGGGDPQTSGPTIVVNSGDTAHQHLFNHVHGITGSHSHTTPNHTHTVETVDTPDWISFNGVEIFLD